MTRWTLRRWMALGASPGLAAEMWPAPVSADTFIQAMDATASLNLDGASFLVVRVPESLGLRAAPDAAHGCHVGPRLCLAIGRSTIAELDGLAINRDRIGLMLDDVDAETSMADFICDSIEAVRFCPEFVLRAQRSLRHGLALDAMLRLSRELGLATLGPASAPNEDWLVPAAQFDYVPSHLREEPGTERKTLRRTRSRSRPGVDRSFQLSR